MLIFVSLLALYVFTLYPSVSPYRDSGDMIASAFTLGVAHPSGYPLYALAGKIFAVAIPFASIAYRINLMSAVFGAAAVAILASRFRGPGRWAFLALGFSAPFWRLSLVSEMYSLNVFFAAVAVVILAGEIDAKKIAVAAFVTGLACGNHLTAVFLAPAVALAAIFSAGPVRRDIFSLSKITLYAALFLLGCSVYVYLPLRALSGADINWGDPSTPERLWRVLTRADYGGLKLHPEESELSWTLSSAAGQIVYYFRLAAERFGAIFLLLAATGIVSAAVRPSPIGILAVAGFVISGPLFSLLANLPTDKASTPGILEPHFVMPDMFLAVCAWLGAQFALRPRGSGTFNNMPAIRVSVFAALMLASAGILARTLPGCFYRDDFHAHDYARNVLATAEPESIIYDPDDTTAFATDYRQYVMGLRSDVKKAVYFRTRWGYERLKRRHPDILPPREIVSGRELAAEIVNYNKASRMILADLPSKFPSGHAVRPRGIMHEIAPDGSAAPTVPPEKYFNFYFMRGVPRRDDSRDFFSSHVVSYYSSALSNIGLYYASSDKNSALARRLYLEALAITGDLSAAWNNLGALYFASGDYARAAAMFETASRADPANLSSSINAGMSYARAGDADRAVDVFGAILRKRFNPVAANELGLIYYGRGNYAEAERFFSGVIRVSPSFSAAYYNMGLTLSKTRPTESKKYFDEYERMTKK